MKIKPEHFAELSAAIAKVRDKFPGHTLDYCVANNIGKDHSMRWRWDLLHAAQQQKFLPDSFLCGVLYKYLDDTHIDTALRKIVGV